MITISNKTQKINVHALFNHMHSLATHSCTKRTIKYVKYTNKHRVLCICVMKEISVSTNLLKYMTLIHFVFF